MSEYKGWFWEFVGDVRYTLGTKEEKPMIVYVLVGGRRCIAEMVRGNKRTVLVSLIDGKIIKRHRIKHQVHIPTEQDGLLFKVRVKWDNFCAWIRWKIRGKTYGRGD